MTESCLAASGCRTAFVVKTLYGGHAYVVPKNCTPRAIGYREVMPAE
jgi:hypothetical protein